MPQDTYIFKRKHHIKVLSSLMMTDTYGKLEILSKQKVSLPTTQIQHMWLTCKFLSVKASVNLHLAEDLQFQLLFFFYNLIECLTKPCPTVPEMFKLFQKTENLIKYLSLSNRMIAINDFCIFAFPRFSKDQPSCCF